MFSKSKSTPSSHIFPTLFQWHPTTVWVVFYIHSIDCPLNVHCFFGLVSQHDSSASDVFAVEGSFNILAYHVFPNLQCFFYGYQDLNCMDSACSLVLPDVQMYRNSSKMVQFLFNGHTRKRLDCKPMTSTNVQVSQFLFVWNEGSQVLIPAMGNFVNGETNGDKGPPIQETYKSWSMTKNRAPYP